jgi:hypothetical protein
VLAPCSSFGTTIIHILVLHIDSWLTDLEVAFLAIVAI